ncbi:hypothetical protein D5R93_01870 [Actinomyces lilanjuaniae]|uniref:Uncharacterized protein n=2 Tax=Actinomyces lilanjuaniae TaxID=2321394 RepID=A0ABM6Z1N9_9ACTO|nr:hypothetical protein D5R93_01870 [Actinomyces lilanjuaniae]
MEEVIMADTATGAAERINEMRSELRDLDKMHLDVRQNRIRTALTIVTAVFAPPTLIVGWDGMGSENMPELAWPWGTPRSAPCASWWSALASPSSDTASGCEEPAAGPPASLRPHHLPQAPGTSWDNTAPCVL